MSRTTPRQDLVIERVLRCVEQIPSGRVAAYGVIARVCGIGPRQVGSIMRHWGSNVTWWRVTNAAGDLPGLMAEARPLWDAEGIRVKENGLGCRYADFGVDEAALSAAWEHAVADLPEEVAPDSPEDAELS